MLDDDSLTIESGKIAKIEGCDKWWTVLPYFTQDLSDAFKDQIPELMWHSLKEKVQLVLYNL